MLKLLFFGSDNCDTCRTLKSEITKEAFPSSIQGFESAFIYIDSFSDKDQEICDKHGVDSVPRLKIFDSCNKIVFDKEGYFDVKELWSVLFPSDEIRKKAQSVSINSVSYSEWKSSQKTAAFNISKKK